MNSITAFDIINLLCDKLGIAVNWTIDQAESLWPRIEALLNEFATGRYYMWLTFTIIFTIICVGSILMICCRNRQGYYESEIIGLGVTFGSISGILLIVSAVFTVLWRVSPNVMAYKWIFTQLTNKG